MATLQKRYVWPDENCIRQRIIYRFNPGKKRQALFNINSLRQQNIKSCDAKEVVKTTITVKDNSNRSH